MLKDGDSTRTKSAASTGEELMQRANQSFQRRTDAVDSETIAELDRIRQQVVAEAEKPRKSWFMQPAYAGALAGCLVIAVAVFSFYPQSEVSEDVSELEMVLVNGDFEMLAEDLEFYQWLEGQIDEA